MDRYRQIFWFDPNRVKILRGIKRKSTTHNHEVDAELGDHRVAFAGAVRVGSMAVDARDRDVDLGNDVAHDLSRVLARSDWTTKPLRHKSSAV